MSDIKKVERKMKLFNTLTREVEELETIEPGKVRMYTCGLTVYSHPQIGNWVAYIYSDVLTRTLKALGYEVKRIQNITDVGHLVSDDDAGEDKMEKGARAEGLTAWDVAKKYIKIADEEAYTKLKLLRPTKLVRATSLIPEQIEFIRGLEDKGFTYIIDDGVYFDTTKIDDYGELAKIDVEGLSAGARVAVGGRKSKTDFALWKFSPKDQKRDMEWDSPWGKGFPGWHLECSVIARENLGDQIDLHTGGIDHSMLHHPNEIAQTESLTGKKPFSRMWFHNNFIKIDGAKLSKSLNNSYTLDDIEKRGYSLDAFKLLVLSSHYRTEGNFTWEILEAAQNRLNNWQAAADLRWQFLGGELMFGFDYYAQRILEELGDDLGTPDALSVIDAAFANIEKDFSNLDTRNRGHLGIFLHMIKNTLGIDLLKPKINDEQKELLSLRQKARDNKDFAESDRLRDELKSNGLDVRDTDNGQIWSRV